MKQPLLISFFTVISFNLVRPDPSNYKADVFSTQPTSLHFHSRRRTQKNNRLQNEIKVTFKVPSVSLRSQTMPVSFFSSGPGLQDFTAATVSVTTRRQDDSFRPPPHLNDFTDGEEENALHNSCRAGKGLRERILTGLLRCRLFTEQQRVSDESQVINQLEIRKDE